MRGSVYSSPSKLSSRINKLEMTSPRTGMASPVRTSLIVPKTVAKETKNFQDSMRNRALQVRTARINLKK